MLKFSDCINELTFVWLDWMRHDGRSKDDSLPFSDRRASAKTCEELIAKEYEIIDQMNSFFES